MRITKRDVVAVLVIFAVFAGSVDSSHEFQITTDPHKQMCPAIYEDVVVWQDNRHGNWDIYGFNLSTNQEFQITDNPYDQERPALYGDVVVWEDYRNNHADIYGYNLSTGEEFQITAVNDQRNPAIYKDTVVWQDDRNGNWDIYGYNVETHKEFQITHNTRDQHYPAIYGDIIVWRDERNSFSIYGYTISTGEEVRISDTKRNMHLLALHENTVVWVDETLNEDCIYSYDLLTKKRSGVLLLQGLYEIEDITIYNNIIVWTESSPKGSTVCGYNLLTSEKLQITTSQEWYLSLALYETTVVWADNRENWDIYGCDLTVVPTEPLPRSRILLLMDYIPLEYLYIMVVAIALVGAHTVANLVGNSPKIIKESKDFNFSSLNATISLIIAILSILVGFFIVSPWEMLYGFIILMMGIPPLIIYFWYKKTPYIRVTNDEILVSTSTMGKPEIIPWNTIQDISFQPWRSKIKIIRSDDPPIEIDLSFVDRMERGNLASILSVRFSKSKSINLAEPAKSQ